MAIRLPGILNVKHIFRRSNSFAKKVSATLVDVPKGNLPIYVGGSEKKRFIVPISILNEPPFRQLLGKAEEEFGFHHLLGGLTIPCSEGDFIDLNSRLHESL